LKLDHAQINQLVENYFPGLVGFEFTHVEAGSAECHVDIHEGLHNPGGILHGGVPYAMADTSMAMALLASLDEGQNCATIEIKITYMKAVVEGKITCVSRVLKQGKRIAMLESEIRDETDLIAKASGSFYISTA